jgi:hypothetical protein
MIVGKVITSHDSGPDVAVLSIEQPKLLRPKHFY